MTGPLPPSWPRPGGDDRRLELDQLRLTIRRGDGEYWLETGYFIPGTETASEEPLHAVETHRFFAGIDTSDLSLNPRLADRPVVSRPQVAAMLLPRERVTLLISTALWLQLDCNERTLVEKPVSRLSDTWFGPSTREGELCYASQTRARQELLAVENPWRALTPVTIINRGNDNLQLERINLPVMNLTLYGDGKQFWTSALTIAREGPVAAGKVQVEPGPPRLAPTAQMIAPPRKPVRDGVFDKAISLLFA